jgi:hypothetical protein
VAEALLTGGCQCGAVRYALHTWPQHAHICHCRMCQKAFGAYFAAFAGVPRDQFEVTRGEIATFMSSDQAERGFCRDCGTPLTFRYIGRVRIAFSLGSLDHPERVKPEQQIGVESRLPWFGELCALPGNRMTVEDEPEIVAAIARSNHQHPDRDTETWPQAARP